MAGRAAHSGVEREPGVEVELPAEFDLGAGERILHEAGDLGGPLREAQRQDRLEFDEVFRIGQPGIDLFERDRAASRHAGSEGGITEFHRLTRSGGRLLRFLGSRLLFRLGIGLGTGGGRFLHLRLRDRLPSLLDRGVGLGLGGVGLLGHRGRFFRDGGIAIGIGGGWRRLDHFHFDDLTPRRGVAGRGTSGPHHDEHGTRRGKNRDQDSLEGGRRTAGHGALHGLPAHIRGERGTGTGVREFEF